MSCSCRYHAIRLYPPDPCFNSSDGFDNTADRSGETDQTKKIRIDPFYPPDPCFNSSDGFDNTADGTGETDQTKKIRSIRPIRVSIHHINCLLYNCTVFSNP